MTLHCWKLYLKCALLLTPKQTLSYSHQGRWLLRQLWVSSLLCSFPLWGCFPVCTWVFRRPLAKVTWCHSHCSILKLLWEELVPISDPTLATNLEFAPVMCRHVWVVIPDVWFDDRRKVQSRYLLSFFCKANITSKNEFHVVSFPMRLS